MNKFLLIFLCFTVAASSLSARDNTTQTERLTPRQDPVYSDNFIPELGIQYRAAAQGTTRLAFFRFDLGPSCVTEGWLPEDNTAQTHDFWHVADGTELDGGAFGSLLPLEGSQSLWCGADGPVTAAEDLVLCGYGALPGYGNDWNQAFCLKNCLVNAGGVVVDAVVSWDSEPGYDATTLQVDNCDGNWADVYGGLGVWDGFGTDTVSIAVSDTLHSGFLRIRFSFLSDGAWSDSDGLWDTDGAFLLDQLTVSDTSGVRVAYEDFEDETPGDNDADDWETCTPLPYGNFSALYPGLSQIQEDPCNSENDCLWGYFQGSTATYSCGGYPSQIAVPYVNARNQYINNSVFSPDIAIAGTGTVWEMRFDVYRDLQLDALVFYTWAVRSTDTSGCPGGWTGDGFVRYGSGKDWLRSTYSIGQYLEAGATHISLNIGARDMCEFWCGVYGTGSCHSHAPLIDDVEVYRVASYGPQWAGRDIDMFQDNFSEDGTSTGTARADMASDILPASSAGILPGDSARVDVVDPENGLDYHTTGDSTSGAAVYFYCSVDGPHAATAGVDLIDDTRYHYIGTVSAGGRTWNQIQMDTTWNVAGGLVSDRYNIDLNDNLFVPGDTVWFFFGARSAPPSGLSTYWALPVPTATAQTGDINLAAANPDEFTILPAGGVARGGDLLYVDGMNFRGAQPFFDTSFEMMLLSDVIDRYDIRGPSSGVANHPGARVQSYVQLADNYHGIIWSCGDLETAFADGSGTPDKSDDTGLLFSFLDNLPGTGGGVYLSGDDVADKWLNVFTSVSSIQLRTKYMTFGLTSGDHVPNYGISPLVVGDAGGIYQDGFGVDTMVVYGGCPLINDFDVLTAEGTARVEMSYHGQGNTGGAVISDTATNAVGNVVGFVLSGFSYHYIRDIRPMGIPVRAEHLHRTMTWLVSIIDYPTPAPPTVARVNDLRQNYPNPFNPVTTIKYQVRIDGPVTLTVYNVAGQLIRTLVDETVKAGVIHEVRWNGDNNTGSRVSSGVYFYKLVAGDYTKTRKMVLLK